MLDARATQKNQQTFDRHTNNKLENIQPKKDSIHDGPKNGKILRGWRKEKSNKTCVKPTGRKIMMYC